MSNSTGFSFERFHQAPIVAILRGYPPEVIYKIAKIYENVGLTTLEVTMNTEGVEEIVKNLRVNFPNLNIGIGTVCTLEDLNKAINAGAQFIVTPNLSEEVIKKAKASGVPIFPGAFTPTEIYQAWSYGADAVKVFPMTQFKPSYIKDIHGPFNDIKLIPTGGVSIDNIDEFFANGAYGVGMGNAVINKKLVEQEDWDGIEKQLRGFKDKF